MKKLLQILCFVFFCFGLQAKPIEIEDSRDYLVLERFFKAMTLHADYGYVIEGSKPIAAVNIRPLDDLIAPESIWFQLDVLSREAIKVWDKVAPKVGNIVLKTTEIYDKKSRAKATELLLINKTKLKEVIEENLPLFTHSLGPTLTPDVLIEQILTSNESLDSILNHDNALYGIVLGYGAFNSTMHSRAEEIQSALALVDIPPFSKHSDAMTKEGPCQLNEKELCILSLTMGHTPHTATERKIITPTIGYNSLEEELEYIQSQKDSPPKQLLSKKPKFIFSSYRNSQNSKIFKELTKSQKKTLSSLKRANFLKYVLTKTSGKRSLLKNKNYLSKKLEMSGKSWESLAHLLYQYCCQLDKETIPHFLHAFAKPSSTEKKQYIRGMMPGMLTALQQAKKNLALAKDTFFLLSQKEEHIELMPQYLYYKREHAGSGQSVAHADQILVSYSIEGPEGTLIAADHNSWIKLSETIPGFAHGVKDMQEGEVRTIYIHPTLAYGICTNLPPCTTLIAKVTLLKVDMHSESTLLPLHPIDLSYIENREFYQEIEEASYALAQSLGSRWGSWLQQSEDIDFTKLCHRLNALVKEGATPVQEYDECNRIFWNLLANEHSLYEL